MSSPTDLYRLLGVKKTATSDELKHSFRKLAKELHPDVAGDDPEAAAKFSEIREAYEILIDPIQRTLYDNPPKVRGKTQRIHRKSWRKSPAPSPRQGAPQRRPKRGWEDPNNRMGLDDIFQDHAATKKESPRPSQTVYRREKAKRGEDLKISVDLPLSAATDGGSVMIEYKRHIRGDDLSLNLIDEIHQLRVPPGTIQGQTLRVQKMGHAGFQGGPYGDLLCKVNLVKGENPTRGSKGKPPVPGVHTLQISIPEAVLGGRVEVQTPGGRLVLTIPPSTSSGTRMRLRGKGEEGADFFIQIEICVPTDLDAESRSLIREFAALNPQSPRDG
jgi:DnaJ-class molecular chaperone